MYQWLDRLLEWLQNRSTGELIDIHDGEWLFKNETDPILKAQEKYGTKI